MYLSQQQVHKFRKHTLVAEFQNPTTFTTSNTNYMNVKDIMIQLDYIELRYNENLNILEEFPNLIKFSTYQYRSFEQN